jgi:hypothetical protein
MLAGLSGVYHTLERRRAFGTAHVLWLALAVCATVGAYIRVFINAGPDLPSNTKVLWGVQLCAWVLVFFVSFPLSVILQMRNRRVTDRQAQFE